MPKEFKYNARKGDGKKMTGTIRVSSEGEAVAELRKRGLVVLSINEVVKKKILAGLFKVRPAKRIKADELSIFTRQLSTMISAGIPLLECLDVLREQTDNPGFKLVLDDLVEKVRGGADFSEALESHSRIFSRIYVSMVRAGEAGGQLDAILVRLAEYLESAQALKRSIQSAMTYPVISLCLITAIVVGLMVGILPKFKKIFDAMAGGELPALTRILMDISALMKDYFYLWIGGAVGIVFALMAFKKTTRGEYYFHWLVLRLPIFGDLFKKVAVSRFTRTFATLIQSGVPILGALEIVGKTAGNRIVENAINDARENVRKGEALSEPLARSGVFPPMVTRMIGIGEKSGALESLLEKISEFYDQQVKATVESLTSLIEPLLIGVMGAFVGMIVLAVFMPIFKLQEMMSQKK
ncbi:Type II secretion system protein F [subsurface metagenome]